MLIDNILEQLKEQIPCNIIGGDHSGPVQIYQVMRKGLCGELKTADRWDHRFVGKTRVQEGNNQACPGPGLDDGEVWRVLVVSAAKADGGYIKAVRLTPWQA